MKVTLAISLLFVGSGLQVVLGEESLHALIRGMATKEQRVLPDKGQSNGSTQGMCSLCTNGAPVGNPNDFVPELNDVTCSKLDSFLRKNIQASDLSCEAIQQELSLGCGCCPGICPKGEKMSYPNRIIPFDVNNNTIYDDTCSDLDMLVKSSPYGNEACYEASYASEYCGCKSYTPTCTPCYNNDVMPDYSKVLTDENGINGTCGETALDTIMNVASNTLECAAKQTGGFLDCRCPSISPVYGSACTLCMATETLNGSTIVDEDEGYTCNDVNEASMFVGSILVENSCNYAEFLRIYLGSTCCTPKKGGKGNKAMKDTAPKGDAKAIKNEIKNKIAAAKAKMFSK